MVGENGERYIKATRELMFAWVFRAMLAVVSGLGWWTLNRITTIEDDIARALHSHDISLEVLKDDTGTIKTLVSDHEIRLRILERPAAPPH